MVLGLMGYPPSQFSLCCQKDLLILCNVIECVYRIVQKGEKPKNFNQLEYFCTAVRCQSLTQAAKKLYVTQPRDFRRHPGVGEGIFRESLFSHPQQAGTDIGGPAVL